MSNAVLLGTIERPSLPLRVFAARVPAGFPSPALDHMEQRLSLDSLLEVQAPHTYVVRVSGDSMQGAGIFDGDLLVVSRALSAQSGDVVVAAVNGEVFVKRLCRDGQQIILRSENPRYAPRYILEGDELLVWGVVTHSIHGHRTHA
jgi:DNA polymerase V